MTIRKHEFYSRAEDSLTSHGYGSFDGNRDIKGKARQLGYTFPASESKNVEQALKNCRNKMHEKINTENGSITFIFS